MIKVPQCLRAIHSNRFVIFNPTHLLAPFFGTLNVQGVTRLAGFESGADCVNRPSNGFAVRRVRRYKSSICNRLVALCAPCVSSTCRQQAFVLRPCPRRFQFPGRSKGVFRMRAAFRARLDDEALLGVRRGGKRSHGRGLPRKTVLPLVH